MPSIHDYAEWVKLLLSEFAKYFALLLFVVLAIRLWKRLPKLSGGNRRGNFFLACLATMLAFAIGYFSICHSISKVYLYYGMRAFHSYKLGPALSLFETSLKYRESADALGGKGICQLWSGDVAEGIQSLDKAKALRKGKGTPFENYYKGLYYFYLDDLTNAVPLLEVSSVRLPLCLGSNQAFCGHPIGSRSAS